MDKNNIFHRVRAGEKIPEEINVIIEIPKGSRVKYEINKEFGLIEVDRVLKTPINYPFSYGLIPQTWNDYDHDPLDVILVSEESFVPGCLVKCRVIGMIGVDDSGERDDKILAVPLGTAEEIQDTGDLSQKDKTEMQYFLERYKDLENKKVAVNSWDNKSKALEFVSECVECYKKKFSS